MLYLKFVAFLHAAGLVFAAFFVAFVLLISAVVMALNNFE